MANLLEVKTSTGTILIAVNSSDTAARQVGAAEDKIATATETLAAGLDRLVALSNDFAAAVAKLGKKAKKAELEVGLELTGEGKFFFASASATASLVAKIEFDLTQ
jgi:hypothetical protein